MTQRELFCQLQDSVETVSAILKIRSVQHRANTTTILKLLRMATSAAQELDNRAAGNQPKEIKA